MTCLNQILINQHIHKSHLIQKVLLALLLTLTVIPAFAQNTRYIEITLMTGNDDLRKGSRVNLHLVMAGESILTYPIISANRSLGDRYEYKMRLTLNTSIRIKDIRNINIEYIPDKRPFMNDDEWMLAGARFVALPETGHGGVLLYEKRNLSFKFSKKMQWESPVLSTYQKSGADISPRPFYQFHVRTGQDDSGVHSSVYGLILFNNHQLWKQPLKLSSEIWPERMAISRKFLLPREFDTSLQPVMVGIQYLERPPYDKSLGDDQWDMLSLKVDGPDNNTLVVVNRNVRFDGNDFRLYPVEEAYFKPWGNFQANELEISLFTGVDDLRSQIVVKLEYRDGTMHDIPLSHQNRITGNLTRITKLAYTAAPIIYGRQMSSWKLPLPENIKMRKVRRFGIQFTRGGIDLRGTDSWDLKGIIITRVLDTNTYAVFAKDNINHRFNSAREIWWSDVFPVDAPQMKLPNDIRKLPLNLQPRNAP